jgi:hypothetical protein
VLEASGRVQMKCSLPMGSLHERGDASPSFHSSLPIPGEVRRRSTVEGADKEHRSEACHPAVVMWDKDKCSTPALPS